MADEKEKILYRFYESIKNGGDFLTSQDLDVAINTLRIAEMKAKIINVMNLHMINI